MKITCICNRVNEEISRRQNKIKCAQHKVYSNQDITFSFTGGILMSKESGINLNEHSEAKEITLYVHKHDTAMY